MANGNLGCDKIVTADTKKKKVDAVKYATVLELFEVLCFSFELISVLLRGGKAFCQEVTLQSWVDINVGVQRTWRA